jgi:tRNA-binding protein
MHVTFHPDKPPRKLIGFDDFLAVDIRIGTVLAAEVFKEAKAPSLKLQIDFGGGIGIKISSAQIATVYDPLELIGRQVMAVVNFPPRQIGPLMSEVLTLGFTGSDGHIVLASPDKPVPNGTRLT